MTDVRTPLRQLVTDFRAGELDPRTYMRVDAPAYRSACRSLKNWLLRNTGSIERRPGTVYKANLVNQSVLKSFVFNESEKYILAFQNNGLKIYSDSGVFLTEFTGSTDCPWTSSNIREITYTQAINVAIICHTSFQPKVLTRTGASTFTIVDYEFDEDARAEKTLQPYYKFQDRTVSLEISNISSGTVLNPGETCTVTASSAIFSADWVGEKITLNDSVEFEIDTFTSTSIVQCTSRGDYKIDLIDNPLAVRENSNLGTITLVDHGFANGKLITLVGIAGFGGVSNANVNGSRTINEVLNDDEFDFGFGAGDSGTESEDGGGVNTELYPESSGGNNFTTTSWKEQVFSDRRGWPAACVFHENRLWFAGSTDFPDGVWGSRTGRFYNFDLGEGQDDRSIQVALGTSRIPIIRHLVSNQQLQIFTEGAIYVAQQSEGSGLTPSNIRVEGNVPYGVSNVSPKDFDGATVFVQKTGSAARELTYDFSREQFLAPDLTTLSSHLFKNPVDFDVLYGTESRPEQYAFFVNNDGTLAVFHSIRQEQLAAWVPWETRSGDSFDSVAVVGDSVFFSVLRDGKYMLECLSLDSDNTLDASITIPDQGGGLNWVIQPAANYAQNWLFTSDVEGFTSSATLTLTQSGGKLIHTSTGTDPQMYKTLSHAGDAYDMVEIRIERIDGVSDGTEMRIFWQEGAATDFNSALEASDDSLDIIAIADGEVTIRYPVQDATIGAGNQWTDATITRLDFHLGDDAGGADDDFAIDWIAVINTRPWAGQTVHCRSGDYYLGEFTVGNDGTLTVNDVVTSITVGFDYETEVIPMSPDLQLGDGAMTGEYRNISAVVLDIYQTLSLSVDGFPIDVLEAGFDVGNPPERISKKERYFLAGWERDPVVTITQGEPMPAEIKGMIMEVSI